jgi:DNA-binding PadR family transcriptional regulator
LTEDYRREIVRRITKNLLDIQLLRLIQAQPAMWGYRIKKTVEADFHVKLGHGALYPTLNALERRGFLKSSFRREGGRARKVYTVTKGGEAYLQVYYSILSEQLESSKSS